MFNKKHIAFGIFLSSHLFAAAADLVVIVHPSAQAISKEKVSDIFLGKEPTYLPLDYPDTLALKTEFYRKATGRDLSQVKAIWTRVVFTGKGLAPKEFADSSAVKKAVAADPKAVGYIEKSAIDNTIKVAYQID